MTYLCAFSVSRAVVRLRTETARVNPTPASGRGTPRAAIRGDAQEAVAKTPASKAPSDAKDRTCSYVSCSLQGTRNLAVATRSRITGMLGNTISVARPETK